MPSKSQIKREIRLREKMQNYESGLELSLSNPIQGLVDPNNCPETQKVIEIGEALRVDSGDASVPITNPLTETPRKVQIPKSQREIIPIFGRAYIKSFIGKNIGDLNGQIEEMKKKLDYKLSEPRITDIYVESGVFVARVKYRELVGVF